MPGAGLAAPVAKVGSADAGLIAYCGTARGALVPPVLHLLLFDVPLNDCHFGLAIIDEQPGSCGLYLFCYRRSDQFLRLADHPSANFGVSFDNLPADKP